MVTQEEGEHLDDAASILTGNHSENAYTMILGAIGEVYDARMGTGMRAHERWVLALEQLANVLLAIVKNEKNKYPK